MAKVRIAPPCAKEEEAFVAAVRSAYDEDAPRLVYADWLLEHGDPRGEFIQIQCVLRRGLWGREGSAVSYDPALPAALVRRERELYTVHRRQWMAPYAAYLRGYVWERGFISKVWAGASFLDGADKVFARHPVVQLTLEGMKPASLEAFAQTPLPGVRTLWLSNQKIGKNLGHVLLGENLASVEVLSLQGNKLGPAAVARLVTDGHLESLTWLGLANCEVGDAGLAAIAVSPKLRNLASIHLPNNRFTAEGVLAFALALRLPRLRRVDLGEDALERFGAEAIDALRHAIRRNPRRPRRDDTSQIRRG